MLKRTIRILCLLMAILLVPLYAQAAPSVIRILDGKITTQQLWDAFGGGESGFLQSPEDTDYRYRKSDKTTGWKRVDGDALSSTELAENVESGPEYTVLKNTNPLWDDWKDYGIYRFQTYYNITVSQQSFPAGGGVTISGGTKNGSVYEVNENADLTVTFNTVAGYDAQVQVNGEQWQTLSGQTYTHKAIKSASLNLRYVQSADACKVTITVNDPLLGTYSGPESDRLSVGDRFALTVTPFNEATTPGNDRDAYVKSVTVNGTEMSGSYTGTVFKSDKQTVSGDMEIAIEFAPRLVYKQPTEWIQKYPEDPQTLEYAARMNLDKAVSAQIPAIEASIYASVVDQETTAAFDPDEAEIRLQGVINLLVTERTYWLRMDQSIRDIGDSDSSLMNAIDALVNWAGSSNWGDISFNPDERWENVEIILPATDKYPRVETGPLTVVILESRKQLNISGTAAETTVESQENIDAAVKAAVQTQLLAINPGVTQAQLSAASLSYDYTAPAFGSLSPVGFSDVTVRVSLPNGDDFLASSGTVTVPLKRSDIEATLTVTTDGNGEASFTRADNVYHLVLTPSAGYYVNQLVVTDTPYGQQATAKDPVTVSQMTPAGDGRYAYTWDLTAEVNHSYAVEVSFIAYSLSAQISADGVMPYYEGMYADEAALISAVEAEVTFTPSAVFPAGETTLEYRARSSAEGNELWLPLNAVLTVTEDEHSPYYGCHAFGALETEALRGVHVVTADGFRIVSNAVNLTLADARSETRVLLYAPDSVRWEAWAAMPETARQQLLLSGVVDENDQPVSGAQVTFTPALNTLTAGENIRVEAVYAGDAQHKPSAASTTLTLIPMNASVAVQVKESVVPYGTAYQITAKSTPSGLEKLIFAAGVDLSQVDVSGGSIENLFTSVHLLSPSGLKEPLVYYLKQMDDDGMLTLGDLRLGAQSLSENPALAQQLGISTASLSAVEAFMTLFAGLEDALPLLIAEEKPQDVGIYLVGAIVAEANYEPAVDLAMLAITPVHRRIDLGWKNQVSVVSLADLQTPGLLDPKVTRVEEGSIADAERMVRHLFIGMTAEGQLHYTTEQENLSQGAYLEIAATLDWGNVRYSCAPIIRRISVGQQQVNLIFRDGANRPVAESAHVLGQKPNVRLEATYQDGTPVPQDKLDQNLSVAYLDVLNETALMNIEGPGLYLVLASYTELNDAGDVVCAGAAPLLLAVTKPVKAFSIADNTVIYDGQPHFVTVNDQNNPPLPYGAVIVDRERKRINLILPEMLDSYEEVLHELSQVMPMIRYLEENSQKGMLAMFLKNLLLRTQKDLYDSSDYWVEIGGPLPVEPGVYDVYVGAMGWLYSENAEQIENLMVDKAILTILIAESTPVPPPPNLPIAPDTGDESSLFAWLLAMAASVFILVRLKRTHKRQA